MTIAIIPARMASSRFPGKPLADIHGIPMLGHCYFRTRMSSSIDHTYIATCDEEIHEYAQSISAPCIMTADTHERASDRIAEAMLKIEENTGAKHDIVVLVQGDEPMLRPEMVDDLVAAMDDPSVLVANGVAPLESEEEFNDPNEVKVVVNPNGDAVYFSRAPIPSHANWKGAASRHKQVCIIPYRRDYLLEFNSIAQTPLEIIESVDMLRVIESGGRVRMVEMTDQTYSVDTPSDLARVCDLMVDDDLVPLY